MTILGAKQNGLGSFRKNKKEMRSEERAMKARSVLAGLNIL